MLHKDIEQLFVSIENTALNKLDEYVDKYTYNRCHDWRKYVPDKIGDNWDTLTENEKKLVFILCEQRADIEEWD